MSWHAWMSSTLLAAGLALPAVGPASAADAADHTPAQPTPAVAAPVEAAPASPLTFSVALQQALLQDGALRAARANVVAARAQQTQLRSRFFPTAGVEARQGRQVVDELQSPVERHVRRSEGFVRWNLYNGGADRSALAAAEFDLAAAQADARHELEEACERVGKAWAELQKQQALHQHALQRHAEVRGLAERVARQVAAGKSADADGQLAQSALIDAELALQGSAADLAAARAQFSVITGLPGVQAVEPAALPWAAPTGLALATALDDWWALAVEGHAASQAAAARRAAAQARVPLIAPEYLPRADLDLRKTLSERTAPTESSRDRRSWTLSLTYEVPLGGAATARRDDNVARAEAAEAEAWRSLQALRGELAVVRQQALQAADALPALERQRGHLEAVVQASELQYQAGRRSLLQLIDQRDRRFNAEQRAADTRLRLTQAQLRLGVLTGSLATQWGLATADPSAIPEQSTEPTPEWLLPR